MATPTNLPASFTSAVLTSTQMNNLRGAFRILQVVTGSTSTEVVSASTTHIDTGLTATITPQSSSSKVLVYVAHPQCIKSDANVFNCMNMRLLRGGTVIQTIGTVVGFTNTLSSNIFGITGIHLDSPATTSATTYKTQFCSQFGNSNVATQFGSAGTSTIVLMEVSA